MRRPGKIIALLALMVFTWCNLSAQIDVPQADSLQKQVQKDQTVSQANQQKTDVQGNVQKNKVKGNQTIKRIKSSRPDMTKAKGARPPLIVRPSGSGVPKGVGKPGGAGKKVGK